jgi:cation diffusion facilitator CzcD-associated flavoprotein CzcO
VVETSAGRREAKNLVVATGYNKLPKVPEWPGSDAFGGELLHSCSYRDGQPYRGKRVMVVGIGNSGGEIAIDLWEHGAASTCIAVRSPVHVLPRDLFGMPAQVTGIITSRLAPNIADRITLAILDRIYGDLSRYGLKRPPKGPLATLLSEGRVPLLDVGTVELIKQGHIDVVPGIERFTETGVVFSDGSTRELDAVVLATGYRAALDDVLGDASPYVDARGYPKYFGEEAPTPGLFFVGYRNPPIGQLNDISKEARRVAHCIAHGDKAGIAAHTAPY